MACEAAERASLTQVAHFVFAARRIGKLWKHRVDRVDDGHQVDSLVQTQRLCILGRFEAVSRESVGHIETTDVDA